MTSQQIIRQRDNDYHSQQRLSHDDHKKYLRDKTNLMQLVECKGRQKNSNRNQAYSGRLSTSEATQEGSNRREDYADYAKQQFLASKKMKGYSSSNFRQLDRNNSKYDRMLQTVENESRFDQEDARLARQRIDMQTISEPTLVSPDVDYREQLSSRDTPLLAPYEQNSSLDAEVEYSGIAEMRQCRYRRDDSLDSSANEHRIRQFRPHENFERSSSQGMERHRSVSSSQARESFQKQAFKSEQFQMNLNNLGSNHAAITSSSVTTMNSHIYTQGYASRQQQQAHGHNRTSKPRNSEVAKATTFEQQPGGPIANYLLAQPGQMVSYGRRDDKISSQSTTQPTSSSQQLQYGAQQSSTKKSNQGDKYKQQPSSNLLQKSAIEGYMNQLQTSGGTQGFKTSGGQDVDAGHQHSSISKQQMIQNLNQRYIAQNQSISSHQPTNLLTGQPFEHTSASTKMTAESSKQTGSRSKARQSGKSLTQHAGHSHQTPHASTSSVHGHASVKHTKASQAKTATTLYPRKQSSSNGYATNQSTTSNAGAQSKMSLNGTGHSNAALYSSTRQSLQNQGQERPSTAMAGHSHQRESQMVANPPEAEKSFSGSVTTIQAQHRFADTAPSSKTGKTTKQALSSHGRASTGGHNIQGRNLNSNVASHKSGAHSKTAPQGSDHHKESGGQNAQTVLAVNLMPSSSFGTSATNTSYHRSVAHTDGHNSVKQSTSAAHNQSSSQQRPSTATAQRNAKTLSQLKSGGHSNAANNSRQSLQGQRSSYSSAHNTAKSGTRVSNSAHLAAAAASNLIQQQQKNSSNQGPQHHHQMQQSKQQHVNLSQMLATDEADPTAAAMELRQIENMMRASHKSNIFSQQLPESSSCGDVGRGTHGGREARTLVHDSINASTLSVHQEAIAQSQNQQNQVHRSYKRNGKKTQNPVVNTSVMLNDISITSPSTELPAAMLPSTPEKVKKAKLRLETVCLLLAEKTCHSQGEKEKQQAAIGNVLEELIFEQSCRYDQQCLRLLMDFQWQTAGNAQTFKLQEELAEVKTRFETQTQLSAENKELKDQLNKQKFTMQDQERQIRKLERELAQVKTQFEVDDCETRIQGYRETKKPERAASVQDGCLTALVPPLDLSKVKGYEEHLRDKQAAHIKQKEKVVAQPKPAQKSASREPSGSKGLMDKQQSAGGAPHQQQMQTIQHKSTKMNNFMANDEVTLTIMDNLVAAQRLSVQANAASKGQDQRSINSHSMSPTMKGKGRNQNYLNHMRHSQEARPSSSNYYCNTNVSLEQVRQSHNHSATIESRLDERPQGDSLNDRQHPGQLMQRKSSMPPASVHIPLLDFSKLHKPQQPTQSRAATKAMQPKQSMNQQHSKFSTIDPTAQSSSNKYAHHHHQQQKQQQYQLTVGSGHTNQAQTIQHTYHGGNGVREFHQQLQYSKKRTSYESSTGTLAQSLDVQHTSVGKEGSIGASQSLKAQSVDEPNQFQVYSSSNGNLTNKKLSAHLSTNASQSGVAGLLHNQKNSATSQQHPYHTQLQLQLSASGQQLQQKQQLSGIPAGFKSGFNTVTL